MSTQDAEDKPTILVVDDTPDNLTLVSNLLKKDYRVRVAINGEKALKIAYSDAPPPAATQTAPLMASQTAPPGHRLLTR